MIIYVDTPYGDLVGQSQFTYFFDKIYGVTKLVGIIFVFIRYFDLFCHNNELDMKNNWTKYEYNRYYFQYQN